MKEVISTPDAPAAVGPYSQAIKAGGFIYVSGQIPLVPQTGTLVSDDVADQTAQSIRNIETILKAAGASLKDVIKTTVFITNMADFGKINTEYAKYFTEKAPARACVEVSKLPKGAQLEIEAVAYIG